MEVARVSIDRVKIIGGCLSLFNMANNNLSFITPSGFSKVTKASQATSLDILDGWNRFRRDGYNRLISRFHVR